MISDARIYGSQSATLAWDSSPGTNIAGYFLYFGQTSGNYSSKVSAGTNLASTVTGLVPSTTYYFVATAYDAAGNESVPCNEATVTTPSSGGLQLAAIADRTLNEPARLAITNNFSNPTALSEPIKYSLDPGAPAGMSISPTTGRLFWKPSILQGGNIYSVTVRISDSSTPPFTDTQTFNVAVADASQLNFGQAVIAAGSTGSTTASLSCSGALSNINFEVIAPEGRVSNLSVQSLSTNASLIQTQISPAHSLVQLQIINGQYWKGIQDVVKINLSAAPGQTSAFATMISSDMTSTQPGGAPMTTVQGQSLELVLVGQDSLVEARMTNGSPELVLYGPIGGNYQIESTTNFTSSETWNPEFTSYMTNLYQFFPNLPNQGPVKFYRARSL